MKSYAILNPSPRYDTMAPNESGWASYRPVTSCLAVGRSGNLWYVIDRQTYSQIGQPFPALWEAREYAEHREATTFCGRMDPRATPADHHVGADVAPVL